MCILWLLIGLARMESDLLIDQVLALKVAELPILPIHESAIVRASDAARASALMAIRSRSASAGLPDI